MSENPERRFGEIVYTANKGVVERTVISSKQLGSHCSTLNRSRDFGSYDDMVARADTWLDGEIQTHENQLKLLRQKKADLRSPNNRADLDAQPLRRESAGSYRMADKFLDLENIPTKYFEVGSKVFVPVTPKTSSMYDLTYPHEPFFVQEGTVVCVELDQEGTGVCYHVGRYLYGIKDAYDNAEAAKEKLAKLFLEQTRGTIPISEIQVISEEEAKVLREQKQNRA